MLRSHRKCPIIEGVLQYQGATHVLAHIPNRAHHLGRHILANPLHRHHVQGDNRALEDQLSHQHRRPEAHNVQVVLALAQHVSRRIAMDHCRVHSRALPGRQLAAPLEHYLEATACQALHRLNPLHVCTGVAVCAHFQRSEPRAQCTLQEVHEEAQDTAECRPVDDLSAGEVLQEEM